MYINACGLKKDFLKKKDLRICTHHTFESSISSKVQFIRKDITYTHMFVIKNFPSSKGVKGSKPKRKSRGLGTDRLICRYLNDLNNTAENDQVDKNELTWAMLYQQKMSTPQKLHYVNATVREAAMMYDTPSGVEEVRGKTRKRKSFSLTHHGMTAVKKQCVSTLSAVQNEYLLHSGKSFLQTIGGNMTSMRPQGIDYSKPHVCPGTSDYEVKRRTGFISEKINDCIYDYYLQCRFTFDDPDLIPYDLV